jgi:hypothetical protein
MAIPREEEGKKLSLDATSMFTIPTLYVAVRKVTKERLGMCREVYIHCLFCSHFSFFSSRKARRFLHIEHTSTHYFEAETKTRKSVGDG